MVEPVAHAAFKVKRSVKYQRWGTRKVCACAVTCKAIYPVVGYAVGIDTEYIPLESVDNA